MTRRGLIRLFGGHDGFAAHGRRRRIRVDRRRERARGHRHRGRLHARDRRLRRLPQVGRDRAHLGDGRRVSAPITTDVLVNEALRPAVLDISSVTSDLFGATANVDVDVTWTFEGPAARRADPAGDVRRDDVRRAPRLVVVRPSRRRARRPGAGAMSSSTDTSETTSSTVGSGKLLDDRHRQAHDVVDESRSGRRRGWRPRRRRAPVPAANRRRARSRSRASRCQPRRRRSERPPAPGNSGGSLPFTGLATVPLVVLGVAALTAGAAAISGARRRRMTNP